MAKCLFFLVCIILVFWCWGWSPWLHTSSLQPPVIVLHHAFYYLHAGIMGISSWCLQFKCCVGRLWLLTWYNLQSCWKRVLMRNISLLSIDVGRLSPLWVTLFPRQVVLSSMRGGSQLRASKDSCVFPVSVGTMDVPLCFKFLPWLSLNNRPQPGVVSQRNPSSQSCFSQGVYHSNRNEAKTDAQGTTYTESQTLLTPPCFWMSSPVLHLCPKQRWVQRAVKPFLHSASGNIRGGEQTHFTRSHRQEITSVTGSYSSETEDKDLWSNLIS